MTNIELTSEEVQEIKGMIAQAYYALREGRPRLDYENMTRKQRDRLIALTSLRNKILRAEGQ